MKAHHVTVEQGILFATNRSSIGNLESIPAHQQLIEVLSLPACSLN